jgi:metal-responsive CopG/Arc/MetJ family transcriptional regulator
MPLAALTQGVQMSKTRINVFFPDKVLQAAKVLAQRRGTSLSEVVRESLRAYVVTELSKEKDAELS